MKIFNLYTFSHLRLGLFFAYILLGVGFSSCKKFLNTDVPKTNLTGESVFINDDLATGAVTNIYSTMASSSYASGGNLSISCVAGLSSDEFLNFSPSSLQFYENQITPFNSVLLTQYYGLYKTVFQSNVVLEGLSAKSSNITPSVKIQLQGEAYFCRAFAYFYLVNLFGKVPLQTVTDYRITRIAPQSTVNDIYAQIISDLFSAEKMLNDNYITLERVRPNISVVHALLSRVFLFKKDWLNAEKYASIIINKTEIYDLVKLNEVFLKNSKEAIWQLYPPEYSNTEDGDNFILTAAPTSVALRSDFAINGFEPKDGRKTNWINSYTDQTGTYYYPFKYKVRSSQVITEYSMVMRLAEQYLIRSEARAQQGNLAGAIDDLDKIRDRAGLEKIKVIHPEIEKSDLLRKILDERKVELFSEWGHRWFDLIRTNQANSILSLLKSDWNSNDILYPFPNDEISRNPNIRQNPGY